MCTSTLNKQSKNFIGFQLNKFKTYKPQMSHFITATFQKMSAKKVLLFPALFILFALSLNGCSYSPSGNFSIPFAESDNNDNKSPGYTLQPHDTLSILYRFDTLGNGMYRISPHDRLTIKFFTVPEYDDIYQVRPDGYISLPQLGEFKAKELTVAEIQKQLEEAYRPILKRPAIFVSLAEYQVHMRDVRDTLADPRMGHTRVVTVRDDFKITLPMIGELDIKGKSLAKISQEANARYAKQAPGIGVDILLKESQPRNFYVFGAVKKPGNHKIRKSISLFKALAIAGGATSEANLDTVVVLTRENNMMVAKKHNFMELLAGNGKATVLNPEDILFVPKSRLSTTAEMMRHISDILLFNGFDLGFNYRLDE